LKTTEIRSRVCNAVIVVVAGMLVSGCANQAFKMTGGGSLSPEGMQHMVLRAKYPEGISSEIPDESKRVFENTFLRFKRRNVSVVGKESDPRPESPYYYLDTEVTKYKPGSPFGRFLLTPAIAFGLWGSFVDVDYSVCDPTTNASLGKGVIRKANLWGGLVGLTITSETQLEDCPSEVLDALDNAMKKQ
jgi:hypothetical protein